MKVNQVQIRELFSNYGDVDMLFIDAQMQVVHIHRYATPQSEAIIDSQYDSVAVIELNGGAAERFGISPGSKLLLLEG